MFVELKNNGTVPYLNIAPSQTLKVRRLNLSAGNGVFDRVLGDRCRTVRPPRQRAMSTSSVLLASRAKVCLEGSGMARVVARFTQRLTVAQVEALEARGARTAARGDPRSFAATDRRLLERYFELLRSSDPRRAGKLTEAEFELLVAFFSDPWRLDAEEIGALDTLLVGPELRAMAAAHGVAVDKLREAVGSLSYAESLYLIDAAEQRHAERA